jgi:ParB/RepB/Spo0J family partition protein
MGLDVRELALDKLSISAQNVRKDPGDLTELIASITKMGVLEPILVRPMGEGYEVIAGSRRFKAAREAGLTMIPASVLELTDVQAILTSLIENLQRQDISVVERVEAYNELQALEPAYHKKAALAKVVGLTPQKIGQELQAYEIAVALEPYGIRVESHFHRKSPERHRGEVLPEYHAVLLHQASAWLRAKDIIPDDRFVALQVEWAQRIAPHSQEKAEEIIAELKSTAGSMDKLISQQDVGAILPPQHPSSQQNPASPQPNPDEMWEKDGGVVTCEYCEHQLPLIHLSDGTHQLRQESMHPKDQRELPGLFS